MLSWALASSLLGTPDQGFLAPAVDPKATVEMGVWRGMDSVVISNRHVEVIVIPSIGRVMSIKAPDGPNILFAPVQPQDVGGWINYGGDKLWTAPQSAWGWPPDPALDGSRHTVTLIEGGIRLTSPISPKTGFQVSRTIRIAPHEPRVIFSNTLSNLGKSTQTGSAWQVAQLPLPVRATMEMGDGERGENPIYTYKDNIAPDGAIKIEGQTAILTPQKDKSFKVGTGGRNITMKLANGATVSLKNFEPRLPKNHRAIPDSMSFPDEGSVMQIFLSDAKGGYGELETVGRTATLPPGESASFVTALRIEKG